jgi:small conductance mechanosensitive channel
MLVFKPFKVGDFIEGGGTAGVVEEIEIFTTQLKTPDNKKIIVPNASMTGGNIINYSAKDCRRVDMVFGVGYGDDLDKVRSAINEVISADERVLADPAPTVGVVELADSSVNFVVRPWVKTADYWDVYFAIHEAMKKRFDAENISIPFPQRDVHLIKDDA